MSGMETSKPSRHWFHISIQFIVAASCIYWLWHLPAPNKAVLLLAGVAAIMGFVEMRPIHKAIYFLLIIWLMFIENRAIDKDRFDFVQAEREKRKEETRQFSDIRDDLKATIKQGSDHFDATMARSDTIIAGVSDSMRMQTGGDSFAFITFTPEPGNVQFNQFPATSGSQFLVSITSHGKYPLREIRATMMDDDRRLAAMEEYNKHPDGDWMRAIQSSDTRYQYPYLRPQSLEGPSGDVELLGMYPFPKGDSKRLSIAFSGLNGYWNETLHLGRVNGAWHQCLSVMGPTVKQATNPFIYCDSDWPEGRTLAEKDWPRLKQPSPHR